MDKTLKIIKEGGISDIELNNFVSEVIKGYGELNKVLIIPPDGSRAYSYAGDLTNMFYKQLKENVHIDILPALGTHFRMTDEELEHMFGNEIPKSLFKVHDWKHSTTKIGTVPEEVVKEITFGKVTESVDIEIHDMLLDESYDAIISIGQVVPHEVVGMANYTKNILVGCGGVDIINKSHFISAVYGIENTLGKAENPVRALFDYAQDNMLSNLPIKYIFTVTTVDEKNNIHVEGIFSGTDKKVFNDAAKLSSEKNINYVDKKLKKVIAYLDENEFKSTWIGNKSIYRTRLAIADEGELIVLAPGIITFGEDKASDALIRKYGYKGRDYILEQLEGNEELHENRSTVAHLIQGSTEGRFNVTYAVRKVTKEEINQIGFDYADYDEMSKKYNINNLKEGYNTIDGEEVYVVKTPSVGLWIAE